MLQRIKFCPKVVRVTKDYKIFKTKEYGMTQYATKLGGTNKFPEVNHL